MLMLGVFVMHLGTPARARGVREAEDREPRATPPPAKPEDQPLDDGAQSPWFDAYRHTRLLAHQAEALGHESCRRTALAYEPRQIGCPVMRIAVEFDERGRWAVVVDGVVLRYLPDAESAIEDARRLEATPRRAAYERDMAHATGGVHTAGVR